MTPLLFAAVVVAGAVGAALRYLLDLAVTRVLGDRVPWGILVVNVSGAFALGVLTGGLADAAGLWVWGVGLLGGYTTFGSVSVSTVLIAREGRATASAAYGFGTFAASILAAVAGLLVAGLWAG